MILNYLTKIVLTGSELKEILNDRKFIHKIRFFRDHKELSVSELKELEIIKVPEYSI